MIYRDKLFIRLYYVDLKNPLILFYFIFGGGEGFHLIEALFFIGPLRDTERFFPAIT